MGNEAEILELRFEGNGINPSTVKPHEIAELIFSFEKALLAAIKQNSPEIDTESLLFSFDEIKNNSIDLRFSPNINVSNIVLSGYLLITTVFETGDYKNLNNITLSELKTLTKFSKKHNCTGSFSYNDKTLSSFNSNTEILINKTKVIKGRTSIYGKLIDVGGDNPNIHIRLNEKNTVIFKTSEANAKLLAPKIYEKVKLIGEGKWDADTLEIIDFKLESIDTYSSGNAYNSILELRNITSGVWERFNTNEEISDQLLRD